MCQKKSVWHYILKNRGWVNYFFVHFQWFNLLGYLL